jgi:CxxC motif-containing protein
MVSPVDPPKPTDQGSTKPAEVKMETTPKGVKYQLAAHKTPKKVMDESKKIYISEAQVIKLKEI